MLQIIPERDFPCASKFVALDGCVVRCFFVCVQFASSTPAPVVLRFLDPLSLFDTAPTEPKYESIGSSPDMDERGPMEAHTQRCFERATEIGNSKERSAHQRHANALLTRFNDTMILPNCTRPSEISCLL
jgi:hypothetical protein